MKTQLRLKQIMLAASLMLSSALQAWSPSDLLKYVPSMPSVSQFFTRSVSSTAPEQIEAARIAALTNGQTVATTTENQESIATDAVTPESTDTNSISATAALYLDLCTQREAARTHMQGMVLPKPKDFHQEDFIQARRSFEWQIIAGDVQGLNELTENFCKSLVTVFVSGQELPVQSDHIRRAAIEKLNFLLGELKAYSTVHLGRCEPMNAYVDCRHTHDVQFSFANLAIKISKVLLSLNADMTVPTAPIATSAILVDPADEESALYNEFCKQDQKATAHLETLQLGKAYYQEECIKARQSFEALIIAGNVQELNNLCEDYCQKLKTFTTIDGEIIPKQSLNIRRAAVEKLNVLLSGLSAYSTVHLGHCEPMNAYVDCRHTRDVQFSFANLAIKISKALLSLSTDMTIPTVSTAASTYVDPAAGVGSPEDYSIVISQTTHGVNNNNQGALSNMAQQQQVQTEQKKTETETPKDIIPTTSLSSTLLSKKVVIPTAVVTGVAGAAAVATQTEAGRSAVAGFTANVWSPAYNRVTNAVTSVDYAALGNRGLALVQNNSLSLGAAAATTAVAGLAYKFWPAKSVESKEVKVVSDLEYLQAVKAHITPLIEQDIASLKKGDKASPQSVVALPALIDTHDGDARYWIQNIIDTTLVTAYAEAKEQKTLAPYRRAWAQIQNLLRDDISRSKQVAAAAMLNEAQENDEDAELYNNNK